jgi:hypothetical protein
MIFMMNMSQMIRMLFSALGGYSSTPLFAYTKDSVIDLHINNVFYPVSYHSERGGRPYQEDRFHAMAGRSLSGDSSLFGIYDGHGNTFILSTMHDPPPPHYHHQCRYSTVIHFI